MPVVVLPSTCGNVKSGYISRRLSTAELVSKEGIRHVDLTCSKYRKYDVSTSILGIVTINS